MAEFDVIILGSGPAGLAAAHACAAEGLRVAITSPTLDSPWPQNYGIELKGLPALLDHEEFFSKRWDSVRVLTRAKEQRKLNEAYGQVDTQKLHAYLTNRCRELGVQRFHETAQSISHRNSLSLVQLQERLLSGRVVIDATGAQSQYTARQQANALAYQCALGQWIRVPKHNYALNEMTLMDFQSSEPSEEPTFLYVMPLAPDLLFVEETVLAGRPPMKLEHLRLRLEKRLEHLGLKPTEVLNEEHCFIPMGVGLPYADQRTIGFGAAGGMIHPATGYSFIHSFTMAQPLAEAIRAGLEADGPAEAAHRAYQALWPKRKRRAWALYTFGLETLLTFNLQQTQEFFAAFFELPPLYRRGYFSGELGPWAISRAMTGVFARVSNPMRGRLVGQALSRNGKHLLRGFVPSMRQRGPS